MSRSQETLILIDASSILYRSFYGLKQLTTASGQPVQAIYGFCKSLQLILNTYKPHFVALVWDQGDSGRKEILPTYKATRQAAPSDLHIQKETIKTICDAIKIPQLSIAGFEADDVIFTLAHHLSPHLKLTVVVSPDKDLRQMVTEHCHINDPINKKIYNPETFLQKYEFEPSSLSSYFGLVGDTSDNIPGVRGIGDKRATDLIKQFGTLENIYANLDQIASAPIREKLEADRDAAFLSKQLFTLQEVKNTHNSIHDFAYDPTLWANAYPLFEELEFKSLLPKDWTKNQPSVTESINHNWEVVIVNTAQELDALIAECTKAPVLSIDTETTDTNPLTAKLVGVSLAVSTNRGYYIPFSTLDATALPLFALHNLTQEQVIQQLSTLLKKHLGVVMHNAKYDMHVLASHRIALPTRFDDTMLMASLLRKSEDEKVGLKELSKRLLGEPMISFAELLHGHKELEQVPVEKVATYATHDVVQTLKLYHKFMQDFKQHPTLETLYKKTEILITQILFDMEARGILLDVDYMHKIQHEIAREIAQVNGKIQSFLQAHGYPEHFVLNPQSSKQVAQVLFTDLKLAPKHKTNTGKHSTDREALDQLAKEHPLPALIVEHRELSKLLSTYIIPLPTLVNPRTKRVHTSFSQITAATGRLASSDPNLQNIPVTGQFVVDVRRSFVAPTGYSLISADYSQIELRILAHLTQDPVLIHAFKHNQDIHTQMAAKIFHKSESEVTPHERQIGKRINFSIMYGLTPYGLSVDQNIPLKDAKHYIEQYFEHFQAIKPWMEKIEADAKKDGYVTTMLGRRRSTLGLRESNRIAYEAARRAAVNTVVQGTAADLIKLAMISVDNKIKESKIQLYPLLQIHDELLFECPDELVEQAKQLIGRQMEQVVNFNVPLTASVNVGKTWGDL